jgi:transcriptional regulator with XRE-family HTH domain
MSSSTSTTVKQIWKKLTKKEYRDSYVAAHISNTVASQIFMLREARGWTQKELAQKAGMKQSRISALEDPNYENIEVGTLKRLASAFDVALTARFIPFSELATWAADLSQEKLLVSDFANDRLPQTNRLPEIVFTNVVGGTAASGGNYGLMAGSNLVAPGGGGGNYGLMAGNLVTHGPTLGTPVIHGSSGTGSQALTYSGQAMSGGIAGTYVSNANAQPFTLTPNSIVHLRVVNG